MNSHSQLVTKNTVNLEKNMLKMDISHEHNQTFMLVVMALLTAILLLGQVGMAALPNVEIVTPLILIYTLIFRKKVFYIIYTFVFLEGLIYGFGIWWFNYLYVWSVLAIVVLLLRKNESPVIWSIIAAAYGLMFGMLCAIPYAITGGIGAGVAYWVAGIPFDIAHCVGNFFTTLILFKPVYSVLQKAMRQF